MPDLMIGYFNQSLTGFQTVNGNNVYYDRGKRFVGLNFGISIPLTFFSNAARIKSLELKQQALQKQADNQRMALQARLQNALRQYRQDLSQYTYYKEVALPNALLMINTANISYKSGEIGYLEYLQALQTVSDIRTGYLQAVNEVNQSVTRIHYLINKP
jgi:heavy metal efflux system protein